MQNQARAMRLVTIGLVVIVVLLFAYVAWLLVSPIDLPVQRVDRSIQMTAQVDGRILRVSGTTNLPDGARIDWYLWRESIDTNDWPSGSVAVESGAFSFEAVLDGWPTGTGTAEVSFSCDWGSPQPRHVTDLVGEHCEHLGGQQVYVDSPGDPKQLFVPVEFTVPLTGTDPRPPSARGAGQG
jgi:hypothetical protein